METAVSAIVEGIKIIGVGQKGTRSLSLGLVREIMEELKEEKVPDVVRGAFFGALVIKGLTPDEKMLAQTFTPDIFDAPEKLAASLAPDAPEFVQKICARLLKKEPLDQQTAQDLGDFLFSDKPGDGARGLAASILRVRYETPEEYAGLRMSVQKTVAGPFGGVVPDGDPIVQIAEPFDGVDRSYLITPLLARHIQNLGYRVVSLVGRNSGPKYGNNLLDLSEALGSCFLKSRTELTNVKPLLGWYLDQRDMSPALDRWVDLRRQIIKRPFLSTLERFVDPVNARIVIASAFHPPYAEKMVRLCEDAGFPSAIIVRNGQEGTLAFPLHRSVTMLCTARREDGTYARTELAFDPQKYLNCCMALNEKLERPSLPENARLVQDYLKGCGTPNKSFDGRVESTCAGLQEAIRWINTIDRSVRIRG